MKKVIERIKESKKLKILSVLIVGVLFLLITRITYAYLAPVISGVQTVDIGGSADLVDDFKFVFGDPLNVNATPTTLPENGENYVTSTTATAKLRANSTNNTANSYTFNDLDSSTNYKVSVKVLNSDGNESSVVSNTIDTKTYVNPSITNVTSTKTTTSITVTASAQAGSSPITKYYYSINDGTYQESTSNTYTFSNLTAGTEYTIKVKVVDTKGKESSVESKTITTTYVLAVINSLTEEITSSSIKLTVNATAGTKPITKYYYSKDNGTSYTESTSNTYTFSGLTSFTTYNMKVYVVDEKRKSSEVYSKTVKTGGLLAEYVKSQYTGTQGANGIYLHNSSLTNGAGDNSYRYAGANPNNYVCFGSTATTCPDDNLYRIIGVFGDQVKLIKADYATSAQLGTTGAYTSSTYSASSYSTYKGSLTTINRYYWNNSTYTNAWSESNLNTTNLNLNKLRDMGK